MSSAALVNPSASLAARGRDYLELAKARIVLMVLITTAAGFVVASGGPIDGILLFHVLIGTAFVAGGTNALNQYIERGLDKQMARTRMRPLPSGRMTESAALTFSIFISFFGVMYLGVAVNWIASLLSFVTLASYLFIYTPLKQKTTLCTVIGAVPGAIPPMIGWAAARGSLDVGAWILFAILFLWQLPHFFAISWIYRDDYARAGFSILSVGDTEGRLTARQALIYALLLLPISLLPAIVPLAGGVYLGGAFLAGVALISLAIRFQQTRTMRRAKALFHGSNLYLIFVMTLLVIGSRF